MKRILPALLARAVGVSFLLGGTVVSSALVSVPAWAAPADLSASAKASVAQALYAASATTDAAELLADAYMAKQRRQINALQQQLNGLTGVGAAARARVQDLSRRLAQAQERYVQQLAEVDRAYAQSIAIFRDAVQDIASTPEGESALRQFNAGEVVQALKVLDRLADTRERARRVRSDLETAAERRRIATLGLEARAKGTQQTLEVIARYEEVTRLDPGVHRDWVELGRLYAAVGRLSQAQPAAELALQTATTDAERMTALRELGIAHLRQGELASARERLQQSLGIARRLAAADTGSFLRQLDVSLCLSELASAQLGDDDLQGARVSREESLQILKRLSATKKSPVTIQKLIGAELANLGTVLRKQGDAGGAMALYKESMDLAKHLLAAHPEWVSLRSDLATSVLLVADMLQLSGELPAARLLYQESLDTARDMANSDQSSEALASDVSLGLSRLGDVLWKQDDLVGARAHYQGSLAISRRLAAANPSAEFLGIQVSDALGSLGRLALSEGDAAAARVHFQDSLDTARRLAAANSVSEDITRRVSVGQLRLGEAMLRLGDVAGARSLYQDSMKAAMRLSLATGESAVLQSDIGAKLGVLGDTLGAQGDLEGAHALYLDSLTVIRRAAATSPSSSVVQRQLWVCMWTVARIPGSDVSWQQIVETMEDLQRRGFLAQEDVRHLHGARRRAREAVAR